MILCTHCKRLWPQGTTWCGSCHQTLGKRICPEGHISPLYAECCSTCGSSKLTPATSALNLRVLTWLVIIGLVVLVVPVAIGFMNLGVKAAYVWFMNTLFERIVVLGLFSSIAGWMLGERARKAIGDLWLACFRILISSIVMITRLLMRIGRNGHLKHRHRKKEDQSSDNDHDHMEYGSGHH